MTSLPVLSWRNILNTKLLICFLLLAGWKQPLVSLIRSEGAEKTMQELIHRKRRLESKIGSNNEKR